MKIFVIPATYNEAENIEKFIVTIEEEVFPKIKNHDMYLMVADDFSPDGTGEIVKRLMKKYKNLKLSQGERKGLGAAYVRSMSEAIEKEDADFVISIDADFQFDPHDLVKFVNKVDDGFDMVVQSRYSEGGSIPSNWPIQRKIFSKTANLFVRSVFMRFQIHDWTGGFRAISREVFLKVRPKMVGRDGYIFQIAFLHEAVRNKFKIGEVPVNFTDRKLGNSKIAPFDYIIDVLTFVITTRIKEVLSGSFGKFLVVGGLGFMINASTLRVLVEVFNWHPAAANLVGAAFAIFSNYNLNNLWTFRKHRVKNISSYFIKMAQFYMTSAFGVIFIQTGTIFVLDHLLGRDGYFIHFLIGTAFLLVWNFTIYNRFIWKTHK
jgi:dolichol-phosphate mannosyltransferase